MHEIIDVGVVDEALRTRRVVVCVGSGGVGKTTLSAALGLRAARMGRRTLILTIDPARRLANSLGLSTLGNVEVRIGDEALAHAGLNATGELWAMTLDLRRTWDGLVERHAPNAQVRDRILRNRLYQQLSTQLAGSLEYMAMEKVYELDREGRYDLVLLDTPPTAHALDFLDAPNRLIDLFGNDAAKWLMGGAMGAGRTGLRLASIGSSYILKGLSKFTGGELLMHLGDFFSAFQDMYGGFKERATATRDLLSSNSTAFLLVTSPQPQTVTEATYFATELSRSNIDVVAALANRVHENPLVEGAARTAPELALALARSRVPNEGHPHLSERLALTIEELREQATRDRRELDRLSEVVQGRFPLYRIPRLDRDVHDLRGLWHVNEALQRGVP